MIETLSIDGTNGQQIEASRVDLLSGGFTTADISPMKKYAIVPDKNVRFFILLLSPLNCSSSSIT